MHQLSKQVQVLMISIQVRVLHNECDYCSAGVFHRLSFLRQMLSWQLYTQLFREMQNENAEYVCIDYDNKVQDDNDFEPETYCKNFTRCSNKF